MRNELLVGLGAHVILPYHKLIDGLREDHGAKRGKAIGTTRRGIGPAYEAKAARRGVRMRDLLKPARLRELVAANLDELAPVIAHLGGTAPTHGRGRRVDRRRARRGRASCAPYTGDAGRHVARDDRGRQARAVRGRAGLPARSRSRHVSVRDVVVDDRGGRVPERGHRADADRRASSASPRRTRRASARARSRPSSTATRATRLRKAGGEFGATTGRPRRCGWLDLPALRMGVRLSGMQLARADQARRARGAARGRGVRRVQARRQGARRAADRSRRHRARRAGVCDVPRLGQAADGRARGRPTCRRRRAPTSRRSSAWRACRSAWSPSGPDRARRSGCTIRSPRRAEASARNSRVPGL